MSERMLEYYNNDWQAQNCLGQLVPQQGSYLGYQPYIQYYHCHCSPRDLHNFEIAIEQLSTDGEPVLNYGAKLRLLMADPYKGVELREAIHKLKLALKEAYAI